jgi:hypothetical protein
MSDISKLLRDADPVQHEAGLSSDEAQSIRREMLGAIVDAPMPSRAEMWRGPLTIGAALALVFGVGSYLDRHESHRVIESTDPFTPAMDAGSSGETRRQLQFATPGGTRIIWTFDQNLRLQEFLP